MSTLFILKGYVLMKLFCTELNERFIPRKQTQMPYTHESAVAWNLIKKYMFSMIPCNPKEHSIPQQLSVDFCFEEANVTATLSDGREEKVNLTLQGVIDIIPRAKMEGLMVEYNSSNDENNENDENNVKVFTFMFTPSNFGSVNTVISPNGVNNSFSWIEE